MTWGNLPYCKDKGRMTRDWRQFKRRWLAPSCWSINLAELGQALSDHIQLNLL
jgi:hypothetical protein